MAVAPKPAEPPPRVEVPPPPPPEPPKVTGPTQQDIDNARNQYGSLLSREFAKHRQYPRIAQVRGWQGVVRVQLEMNVHGQILSTGIQESSGYKSLDEQALEMVKKAAPLPVPPEVLRTRQFSVLVPVVFRLE